MNAPIYLADWQTFEPVDDARFESEDEASAYCAAKYGAEAVNNTHIICSDEESAEECS